MPRVTANTGSFTGPLDVIAKAAKATGFDGLEIWERDIAPAGGAAVARSLLERLDLDLSALQLLRDFEGATPDERPVRFAEAERLLDLTRAMGAEQLLVCANTQPTTSPEQDDQVRDLRTLGDMAAERGMRIAFEPLAWSKWINRYEAAFACVEAVSHPAVGIALDCFHLFHQGSPVELVDTLPLERCFLVQLCDARPMQLPAIEIARHHRLLPGEGAWPVADLVRRIEAKGYEGFYNVEVFNDVYRTEDPGQFASRASAAFQLMFETV